MKKSTVSLFLCIVLSVGCSVQAPTQYNPVGNWTIPAVGTTYVFSYEHRDILDTSGTVYRSADTLVVVRTNIPYAGKDHVVRLRARTPDDSSFQGICYEENGDVSLTLTSTQTDTAESGIRWVRYPTGRKDTTVDSPSDTSSTNLNQIRTVREYVGDSAIAYPPGAGHALHTRTIADRILLIPFSNLADTSTSITDHLFLPSIGFWSGMDIDASHRQTNGSSHQHDHSTLILYYAPK